MEELLAFLSSNPGPWAVGFATHTDQSDEYTAGSFHVVCTEYLLNQEGDCISFYQGSEDKATAEVVIPILPLTLVSETTELIVFANANLQVAVEGFEPDVLVYVQSIS